MSSDNETGTPEMEYEQEIADSGDENETVSDNENSKKRKLEESTLISNDATQDLPELVDESQPSNQDDEKTPTEEVKEEEPPAKKSKQEEEPEPANPTEEVKAEQPPPKKKTVIPFHIDYEYLMSDEIAPRLKEILEKCISLGEPFNPGSSGSSGHKSIAGSAIAMWAFSYDKFRELCPNAPQVKPIKPQGMGAYKLAVNFPNLTTPFGYSPYINEGKVVNSFSVNIDETPEAIKFRQFLHTLEEILIEKIHQKKEVIWAKAKLDVPVNVEDLASPRSYNSFVRTKKSNESDASFVVVPMKFESAPLDNRFPKEKKDEWSALVTVFQDQADGSVKKIATELRKHHGNKYSGPEGNRIPSDTQDFQQIIPERTPARGIVELDKVYLSKLGCGNTLKVLFLRLPYDDSEERSKEMEEYSGF